MIVAQTIFDWFYYFFTTYTITIFTLYVVVLIFSIVETKKYFNKAKLTNYRNVLSSPFSPSISIMVPMYNEEKNCVSSIRSFLSNQYVDYEILVINDGSKDETIERLIEAFKLEPINQTYVERIPTQKINGIYKSANKAFEKITLIDKENGGKSDALNMALNYSTSDYVLSVDGDCILANDSLQKMVKPILESSVKVIASGGVIRVANNCTIKEGELKDIKLPKRWVLKFQILEYLRSFLLARIGWSKLRGLMIISGALGLLDRKLAVKVGGYDVDSIGEDMEILVKMQRQMYKDKIKHKLVYLPDPLCWTEAPRTWSSLRRQRVRWTRGTISTLWEHRGVLLNPKFRTMAMFSYPIWVIYERLGPLIELAGIVFFVCASFMGKVNWLYTISFLICTYLFAVAYSIAAILAEEVTYHQYRNKGDLSKLILAVLLEPFTYHVFLLWPALLGNITALVGKRREWGNMNREGLEPEQQTQTA